MNWNVLVNSGRHGVQPNDNVIVISTHVSGLKFLENLLASFGAYDRYPIYVVINEYQHEVEPLFAAIVARFSHLPITLGRLKSNSFEFGGLLSAYDETAYENFFLLSHSCEITDTRLFDIAFEENRGRSAAVFLRQQFDGTHFWESQIGKYRREILTAIDFKRFQPRNIYEATYLSEFGLTRAYHGFEPTAYAFQRVMGPTGEVTEKFGKPRLKMVTPYLIKWKTHWTTGMLFKSFPKGQTGSYLRCRMRIVILKHIDVLTKGRHYLREGLVGLYCGALWSPRFFHWRRQLRAHPELAASNGFIRLAKYNRGLIQFCVEGAGQRLTDHELDSGSLVMDVGAFDGEYAEQIYGKYRCTIHCFEPMPDFFAQLARRFPEQPKIQLHPVGLSDRTYRTTMGVGGMGSSEFGFFVNKVPVQMQDVAEVFATIDQDVDLLKVNIEGGEYALLRRMLQQDLLRRCRKVIVQFHDRPISASLARQLRLEIIEGIEKTHDPIFSYPFVWEGWQRR